MLSLQCFSYQSNHLAVILDEIGTPWFDASQVCNVLGYNRDASDVVKKLKADDKRLFTKEDMNPTDSVGFGNRGEKWFVSEAGLYKLIFRSHKPDAEIFTDWVTHEVLPQIRKTGQYFPISPSDDTILAQAIIIANKKLLQLADEKKQVEAELGFAHKKIGYLQCQKDIRATQAKIINAAQKVMDHYCLADHREANILIYKEYTKFTGHNLQTEWQNERKARGNSTLRLHEFLIREGLAEKYLQVVESLLSNTGRGTYSVPQQPKLFQVETDSFGNVLED